MLPINAKKYTPPLTMHRVVQTYQRGGVYFSFLDRFGRTKIPKTLENPLFLIGSNCITIEVMI